MTHFFLVNPFGETLLLVLLGLVVIYLHRQGWMHDQVLLELLGFLALTVVGFFIPGMFFFLAAVVYVIRRLWQVRRETRQQRRTEYEVLPE